ncbi:MAG: DUF1211 domain-containing protein [Bacteroidetes bacterium]|nr:DUF1211 domain-containing protein [Bacteroidota bacterium]
MNKSRLEAFSDGVFAIAITLLILDIRIPDVSYEQLQSQWADIAPRIAAYVMSFIVIGWYWISHHYSFQQIQKVDGFFLWMNILVLMLVSFIPFPTSLLGRYPYKAMPLILYGCNLIAINLVAFTMIIYAKHHPELTQGRFREEFVRRQIPIYIFVNSFYAVAIAMASFYPVVSYYIYGGVMLTMVYVSATRIK